MAGPGENPLQGLHTAASKGEPASRRMLSHPMSGQVREMKRKDKKKDNEKRDGGQFVAVIQVFAQYRRQVVPKKPDLAARSMNLRKSRPIIRDIVAFVDGASLSRWSGGIFLQKKIWLGDFCRPHEQVSRASSW